MDLDNMIMVYWLVVSNMALEFSMSHMGDIILPIDELIYLDIFFKMVIAPPTSDVLCVFCVGNPAMNYHD